MIILGKTKKAFNSTDGRQCLYFSGQQTCRNYLKNETRRPTTAMTVQFSLSVIFAMHPYNDSKTHERITKCKHVGHEYCFK